MRPLNSYFFKKDTYFIKMYKKKKNIVKNEKVNMEKFIKINYKYCKDITIDKLKQ